MIITKVATISIINFARIIFVQIFLTVCFVKTGVNNLVLKIAFYFHYFLLRTMRTPQTSRNISFSVIQENT